MKDDFAHKDLGWLQTTIEELCVGDRFGFKDLTCIYTREVFKPEPVAHT